MSAKKPITYDISHRNDLISLEKKAKFHHIDQYYGQEATALKRIFTSKQFAKLLKSYENPPILIAPIAVLGKSGLGAIAHEDIILTGKQKMRRLGIYWGKLVKEANDNSTFIFSLTDLEVDAQHYGNWTRFVNHSQCNYNIVANQRFFKFGQQKLEFIEYAAIKNIKRGEQLLVDYGPNYYFNKRQQIFLNPSDGVRTIQEIYYRYKSHYSEAKGKLLQVCQALLSNAKRFYLPTDFLQLLASGKPTKSNYFNLPIIGNNRKGKMLKDPFQHDIKPLMLASYMGKDTVVKVLLKNNVNVQEQNNYTGYDALYYALISQAPLSNKIKIIKLLIKAGIAINSQDRETLSPLHWCVKLNNLTLLKLFFNEKNSQKQILETLDLMDQDEFCPVTYAIAHNQKDIADYLLTQYQKLNKESLFHSRHNDWLMPTFKQILQRNKNKNFTAMLKLLNQHGLDQNAKLMKLVNSEMKVR